MSILCKTMKLVERRLPLLIYSSRKIIHNQIFCETICKISDLLLSIVKHDKIAVCMMQNMIALLLT